MARAEGELPALHLSPPPTARAAFPLGGWLCADLAALDALAGEAAVPPIVRPVQLSLVPDSVADYGETSNAMRHAARLCTVISHQAGPTPPSRHHLAPISPLSRPYLATISPPPRHYLTISPPSRHHLAPYLAPISPPISRQADRMRNAGALRAALLEHLFWRALP